jgi:tetratricopeptide (TPR) repeat protein
LLRRALAIDEKSYGPEHPNVAGRLSNLAAVLQSENRLSEAEPLLRRALTIDGKTYGAEHPKIAIRLNNLAKLLQAENRLAEAEPLLHRSVVILLDSSRRTGHEHPNLQAALANYSRLLKMMGKPQSEIDATIKALGNLRGDE